MRYFALFIIALLFPAYLSAQVPNRSAAEFSIYDVTPDLFTYEFSLAIERNSDSWRRFVNGTFQFEMVQFLQTENGLVESPLDDYPVEDVNFIFAGNDTKSESIKIAEEEISDDIVSITGYAIKTQVLSTPETPLRLSITIQGPPEFLDNDTIPINTVERDTFVSLGRFRISLDEGAFPNMALKWIEDTTDFGYYKYLASAYKLEENVTVNGVQNYFIADDNINFGLPPFGITTSYNNDTTVLGTFLSSFTARYIGNQTTVIKWRTRSEFRASEFRIYRGYKYPFEDDSNIEFEEDPIYVYQKNATTEPLTSKNPRDYPEYVDNTIPADRRGWEVCYRIDYKFLETDTEGVWRETFDDGDLGIACAGIPNSVISYAHAYPNPFRTKTTVEYTAEDDILITAILFDINGREVDVIMNNQPVAKGTYSVDLEFPETASNGIFNLIFYGTPINDTSVEYSNAVLKLQKIR